jgi:GTP-binding protein HflX
LCIIHRLTNNVTRHVPKRGHTLETIYGSTQGLKPNEIRSLRTLYGRATHPTELISGPLSRALCEISGQINRRIGLLINRRGRIEKVVVGDNARVFLPDLGARRAGETRFRGVRLIHTTFQPEGLTEDDLTDLSLLRLDAVVSIRVDSAHLGQEAEIAMLLPPGEGDGRMWTVEKAKNVRDLVDDWDATITALESQFTRSGRTKKVKTRDSAILVSVTGNDTDAAKRSLNELRRLSETANLLVVDTVLQKRQRPDGKTIIGKGKLQELIIRAMHLEVDVLIFDRELSPTQLRNLATATDLKVIDRTQLILDIFATHATSKAGKLQVEFAQLRYRMPRLSLMPTAMSRLTGGIGGVGPGETKLEINRRRAQERLTRVQRALRSLAKQRDNRRKQRKKNRVPVAGIVGYTNAGKSTLLNRVTKSNVVTADKLFATLDPTSRRFRFPTDREVLLTDTVGFINNLPKTLMAAFRATLEELEASTSLVHVLDSSSPDVRHHMVTVNSVLSELKIEHLPTLIVWNKCDIADKDQLKDLMNEYGGIAVSAVTGEGTQVLLHEVESITRIKPS